MQMNQESAMNSKEPSAGGVRYTANYTVPVGNYGGCYVQKIRFVQNPGQTIKEALNEAGYKTQKEGHNWDIMESTVFLFEGWPTVQGEFSVEATPKTGKVAEAARQAQPYIVCSAIRQKDTGAMVCGPRHYDGVVWSQILGIPFEKFVQLQQNNQLPDVDERHKAWQNAEEGFIDQYGRFYTREEAWAVVTANEQPLVNRDKISDGVLYSEHLYSSEQSDTPVSAQNKARSRAAVCMLNAAMSLISSISAEGPKGKNFELAEDTVSINSQLGVLQRKLWDIEDGRLK